MIHTNHKNAIVNNGNTIGFLTIEDFKGQIKAAAKFVLPLLG